PVSVSILQSWLQPSPSLTLPSSHGSCANLKPSPQTAVHWPPVHLGSMRQNGEHPSYGTRLPSSHCSYPSMSFCGSPQTVLWQTAGLAVLHAQPCSGMHVGPQPSPAALLWSSQSSRSMV